MIPSLAGMRSGQECFIKHSQAPRVRVMGVSLLLEGLKRRVLGLSQRNIKYVGAERPQKQWKARHGDFLRPTNSNSLVQKNV